VEGVEMIFWECFQAGMGYAIGACLGLFLVLFIGALLKMWSED